MKKTIKFGGVVVAAMLAVAPVVSSSVVQADTPASSTTVQAAKKNKKNRMKVKHAPRLIFVYDKKGNFAVSNYRYVYFKKGKLIKLWHNAKVVKINGEKYYQIGDNQYIKVSSLKKIRKHHKMNKKNAKKPAWNKKLGLAE